MIPAALPAHRISSNSTTRKGVGNDSHTRAAGNGLQASREVSSTSLVSTNHTSSQVSEKSSSFRSTTSKSSTRSTVSKISSTTKAALQSTGAAVKSTGTYLKDAVSLSFKCGSIGGLGFGV